MKIDSKFWDGKEVLVTGGAGFIGSHLTEMLVDAGSKVTVMDNMENGKEKNLDALTGKIEVIQTDTKSLGSCIEAAKGKDIIMNLAAKVGGIDYNRTHQGTMFRDNVISNTNMLEAARLSGTERFLVVSSACVYRRDCTIPTPESEGLEGVPEPTNMGYGWAKRMSEIQAKAYSDEFGMKIAIVRPYNCYGPRDHFEPDKSHVIPAIIKRIYDGENPLVIWGNGEQSRAFIHVKDLARGMALATEKYPVADPLNLGTPVEIKIKDLVSMIVRLSGSDPDVVFDTSKPSGQPRRNCDVTKSREKIGFEADIGLEDGLRETIKWYEKNIKGM